MSFPAPVILLTTTGAKIGQARAIPLVVFERFDCGHQPRVRQLGGTGRHRGQWMRER
ncbi:MAG: nitroreductase family deazaflavin-dependent oxidoreductase [Chloroflexi bacterium]|nr:nitroreductase family deazaflavin-dependent oxidoreductase [Chloroflexota bacterium]